MSVSPLWLLSQAMTKSPVAFIAMTEYDCAFVVVVLTRNWLPWVEPAAS